MPFARVDPLVSRREARKAALPLLFGWLALAVLGLLE
jgi:hypothetical protein